MIDFLLIILFLVNGVHNIDTDFRAEQGDFKYVVSIHLSGAHLCTGTIIDETHILTIAHVFTGIPVSQLSVVAGMSIVIYPFFTSFSVRKIFPHPEFRRLDSPGEQVENYWVNDIAVLRLTERFHWNSNYGPIQLMQSEVNGSTCPDCVMISWTHPQRDSAEVIQKWNFVYSMNEEECLERDIHVLQNETCFDDLLQNSLITSSKLGSPIVCDGVMIGFAVRLTENRAPRTPSTFLNVLAHSNSSRMCKLMHKQLLRWENSRISSQFGMEIVTAVVDLFWMKFTFSLRDIVFGSRKKNVKVASGYYETSYLSVVTEWSSVLRIIHHSKDHANGYVSDNIAVLVLAEPLIFGLTINSIQYNNAGEVSSQSLCQSFHWKRTVTGGKYKRITVKLMTTHVTKVDNEKCRTMSVFLTEAEFCAGNPYYMYSADTGDIGNPIICEGKPVGIMVRTFPLADDSPPVAVFLQLHLYEEFISSAMSRS